MPSTQPTCTPALCSSPQPPPPQPLGVPGAQGAGAHRHPGGWVRGPSAAGTAHGPAAVFPVFLSAGGRVCFRLFSSCSVAAACWPPPPSHPQQGPGAPTRGFGFAPAHQRASRELASGRTAIRAGDPRGLASCNLTFTRLRGCKGLN